MQKPVVIRTPYPTSDEVAKELGISKKRVRELRQLLDSIYPPNVKKRARKRAARR